MAPLVGGRARARGLTLIRVLSFPSYAAAVPSSSSRSRVPVRRSPRPAPRPGYTVAARTERPLAVPFAAVFGLLVAAEDVYLAWLLWTPETGWDWLMLVPAALALLALAASAAVFWGRARGWLLLTLAAVLPLFGVLVLVVLFAFLGGGSAMWAGLLLLVGPLGALVLALRRPVRDWTRPGPARRPPGGRRRERSAH